MDTVKRSASPNRTSWRERASLYGSGGRKYLNNSEQKRALAIFQTLPPRERLFGATLHWTGGRVSEVLSITPANCQLENGIIAIETLKRRAWIIRELPIPPTLMSELNMYFDLERIQAEGTNLGSRLFPFSRVTAWRIVKRVMNRAEIHGARACPRGIRHGFGVGTLQAGVPLTQTQLWLGHADVATTAIYSEACGPEQVALARRYWNFGQAVSEELAHAG